jgi:hypothetical protein
VKPQEWFLSVVHKSMSRGTASTNAALPTLFGAEASQLITHDQALDDSLTWSSARRNFVKHA